MSLQKSYKLISNALLPDFPVVSEVEKSNIVDAASIFIQKQINLQPYFILVPILVLVFLMAITIQIAGPSFIVFWRKIPGGKMVERLFRSLVIIKFMENEEVLSLLGEKTGKERIEIYRKKRNV